VAEQAREDAQRTLYLAHRGVSEMGGQLQSQKGRLESAQGRLAALDGELAPYHITVGSPPACVLAAALIAVAVAVAGIDTAVAAFACWPFCSSIAPPIRHGPTPHSVTAPAIAFLLILFSWGGGVRSRPV
jgi:hypothetical protein